jgi:tRNA nucleotidyltransferase/poly(A) polymerase
VGYSDGRRPDAVRFGTAEEDVQRRDFTINGILYDPLEDRVLDYVGGQRDLQAGVVRAIGDPRQRFTEDKLRLLRAVRFASRLGFHLEEHTRAAVEEMAEQIIVVAAERIAQEMRAMLTHVNRHQALRLAEDSGLLRVILPEVSPAAQGESAVATWEQTLRVLEILSSTSFTLAMAALLCSAGARDADESARLAEQACRRWRLSNDEIARITWLVEHQRNLVRAQDEKWSKIQPLLIHEGAEELIELHEAAARAGGESTQSQDFCRRQRCLPAEQLNPPPLLTGDDLLAQGLPQGRIYQVILNRVREAQLDGEIATREDALRLAQSLR